MQRILTEQIDGYTVINAVRSAALDPVETQKSIKTKIEATPEFAALENERAALREIHKRMADYIGACRRQQKFPDLSTFRRELVEAEELCQGKLDALHAVATEFIAETAIYCQVPDGQELISDDEAAERVEQIHALEAGHVLTTDGTIPDLRGRGQWKKLSKGWRRLEIDKLGPPAKKNGKLREELSDEERAEIAEQTEKERIASLNTDEKAAELATRLDTAATAAAHMRAKLEIQGDESAASAAQGGYDEEKARLEKLYS